MFQREDIGTAEFHDELEDATLATEFAIILGLIQRVVHPEVQHFWMLGQSESWEHPAMQMEAIPLSAVAGHEPNFGTVEDLVGRWLKLGNWLGQEDPPVNEYSADENKIHHY